MRWLRVLDLMSNRKRRRIPFALSIRPRGVDIREYASNTILLTCTSRQCIWRRGYKCCSLLGIELFLLIGFVNQLASVCCVAWMTGQVQHHRFRTRTTSNSGATDQDVCYRIVELSSAVVKAPSPRSTPLSRVGRVCFMTNDVTH